MRVGTIAMLAWLCAVGLNVVEAQTETITDPNQLAEAFNGDVFSMPIDPPAFRAWLIDPQFFWTDFANLPEQFSAALAESQEQLQGVTVLKVRLTRSILTGETLVEFPGSTNTLTLAAPAGYQTNQVDSASRSALGVWRQWIDWGELDANTAPTLSLDVSLADVQDKSAYDAAIAAEEAACEEAQPTTSLLRSGFGMLMEQGEGGGGFDLLSASSALNCGRLQFNKLQAQGTNFFLEWFSVTNATYEIVSATDMTIPGPSWTSLASLYPAAAGTNLTSFTDVGGATNKAKFYKVAKTGISIALCDSNTYSGVIEIPLEIGIPTNRELAGVNFLLDGQPTMTIINPSISSGFKPSGTWGTLFVTNGWHTIQAVASYPDDSLRYVGNYGVYTSDVVTVQTINSIVFPDFPTTFGTALPVTALLSSSNANWTVNILSSSNTLLRTYSGSTSTGRVDVVWDGNDTNNVAFSGEFVDVEVSFTPTGGFAPLDEGEEDPTAKARVYKQPVGGLPSGFVLSYEEFAFHNEGNAEGDFLLMYGQVRDYVGDPFGPYTLVDHGSVADNSGSWTNWLGDLKDTSNANLYHFGHGGQNGVGIQPSAHRGFTDTEIGNTLTNGYTGGILGFFKSFVVKHPYRFVFLDGCNTGDGDLCVAFGTERKKTTAAQFTQKGLPTRAFMGWWTSKQYITVSQGHQFDPDHYNFVVRFFDKWSTGQSLQNAITQSLPSGFTAPRVWGDDQLTWQ